MKKKTIAITLFPAIYTIIIIFLTILSSTSLNATGALDFVKGIMVISLVVLFPLLILIQAIVSALNRINIFVSLGVSILATMLYIIVLHTYDTRGLSSSMYHYSKIYLMSGIVGYVVGKLIYKFKSSKKIKENDKY